MIISVNSALRTLAKLSYVTVLACPTTIVGVASAQAPPVSVTLASASLGQTGQTGGASINSDQFVGWRFEITEAFKVTEVGGHLLAVPSVPGDIFAALVKLQSIVALPQGEPFLPSEIVATSTFRPTFPSSEVLTPLSAILQPGVYALIFGSGEFGTTGFGGLPNYMDQPDILPTTIDSYFFYSPPDLGWRGSLGNHMRFLVRGIPATPEELLSDLILDVEDCVANEDLKTSHGHALANKLESALQQLDKGNIAGVIGKLQAFIDQLTSLEADGHIASDKADSLIAYAQVILNAVQGPGKSSPKESRPIAEESTWSSMKALYR